MLERLRSVILDFCSPTEISVAKHTLEQKFISSFVGTSFFTERRRSTVSDVRHDELDDVIEMFDHLDQQSRLKMVWCFVQQGIRSHSEVRT